MNAKILPFPVTSSRLRAARDALAWAATFHRLPLPLRVASRVLDAVVVSGAHVLGLAAARGDK